MPSTYAEKQTTNRACLALLLDVWVIVGRVCWSGSGRCRGRGVPRLGRAVAAGLLLADRSAPGDLGQVVVG